MCMRNVNATIFLCSDIQTVDGKVSSLVGMYDRIAPSKNDNNEYYIDDFSVAFNCSIIFDEKTSTDNTCLQLNTQYESIIRLEHVDSGLGTTLLTLPLYITENDLKKWCKNFYECKQFLQVKRLSLPKGLGDYAIKFLVRRLNDSIWTLQSVHSLIIGGVAR